jgi:dolichyl-phosphate beta-glucosyltransferase
MPPPVSGLPKKPFPNRVSRHIWIVYAPLTLQAMLSMTSENVHGTERINNWIDQQPVTSPRVDLSVVIPAYNEERRLPPTLIDVIDFFDRKSISYEVVVIDDGSTDGTAEVVRKFERVRNQVRLIQLPRNYGKGHAVRLGVLNCRGSCILFADADGATPIQEFDRLKAAISEGADVAIGSRALASTETKVATSLHRRFLGRVFNKCVNMILLPSIADTQCGFKMFTRKAALFLFRRQRADRFSFDVELLYMAHKANLAIKEVPINWTNVPGSKVNLVLDSLSMFRDVFRFRVIHRGIDRECFDQFEEQIAETPNT